MREQSPPDAEFTGTDRYQLRRRIGEGGMGVVYEVLDRTLAEPVALKTLQRVSAAAIYRFKREFRTLADVSHHNLVSLHELVQDKDQLFFTMELVDGVDFLEYVRPGRPGSRAERPTLALSTEKDTLLDDDETVADLPPAPPALVEARLRDGLRQLAEGLVALHDSGKLHRDVKPSNVLVTPEGRVVLLDFGLSADLDEDSLAKSQMGMVIGTVAYMAPEQAVGEFTKASDWYSVGVILYQALTSALPFSGSMFRVVLEKQEKDAPDPATLATDLPEDLCRLCRDLLRRDPKERPLGREVLRRLGGYLPSRATPALAWSAPDITPRFVGRDGHLEALGRAFSRAEAGGCTVVHVHGTPGIGKTALVRRFLERLGKRAFILAGRCYEHELVPYKAFDSAIDALCRRLMRMEITHLQEILPEDVAALARVFPVLNRVDPVHARSAQMLEVPDPHELRRRAFAALKTLLDNLATRAPVVLFVDDLQWGDSDSARLLEALLAPPVPRALMLVVAYRQEDRDTSELLRTLRTPTEGVELREIIVGPLDHSSARALALAVLGKGPEADQTIGSHASELRTTIPVAAPPELRIQADRIASESGGNPLFVFELASHARAEGSAPKDLDEVLALRFARLPPDTRRLLDVLAVAGHPVTRAVANRAAGLPARQRGHSSTLVNAHLARSRGAGGLEELECYHGRIRDALLDSLDLDEARALHLALADALEAEGKLDLSSVMRHLAAAGEPDRAAAAALSLARRSADTLALEGAATLSKIALDLATEDHVQFDLRKEHAEALERASNPRAADAYVEAANCASARHDSVEMRRRAAEQYLRFGEIRVGLEVLEGVLRTYGMTLPKSTDRALAELRVERARLLARGLEFDETVTLVRDQLRQADACWTAAVGLTMVDTVTASIFLSRYLYLTLDAGDPNRIARGLAMELAYLASAGKRRPTRTSRVLHTLRDLAKRIDAPYVRGFAALGAGLAAWHEGAWDQSEQACKTACRVLGEQCSGVDWELSTARALALWSQAMRGQMHGLDEQLEGLVQQADEHKNLYASTLTRMNANGQLVLLAADRADDAKKWLAEAKAHASHAAFHLERYWSLSSEVQLALYEQDGPRGWALLTEGWRALAKAGVFRVHVIRWEAVYLRARVALAAAAVSAPHRPLLSTARADGERLRAAGTPYADAWGTLVLAQANRALGLQSEASELFEAAALRAEQAHMHGHALVARLRVAQIMGPKRGKALAMQVLEGLKRRGVVRPNRFAFLLSPDRLGTGRA